MNVDITNVLFEIRLGALSDQRSEETTKFIEAVQGVFLSTQRIFYTTPSFNRIFFRKWQLLHDESWNTVFNLSQFYFQFLNPLKFLYL